MQIKIGKLYWLQKTDSSKKAGRHKRTSIKKFADSPVLVTVESMESGTDKTGEYIKVRYTLCNKGTSNAVKTYLTGKPVVNFIFEEVL